jgi:hypothetical protein
MHNQRILFSLCGLATLFVFASVTKAAFIINIQQSGSDVVANGSGTLTIPGSPFGSATGSSPSINSGKAQIEVGTGAFNAYSVAFTGASNFGSAINSPSSGIGTGDPVLVTAFGSQLQLPLTYVSGAALSDTATFQNRTLAELNLVPGTYTESYGSGATADSITVNIVPEPASISLILVGAMAVLLQRKRAFR